VSLRLRLIVVSALAVASAIVLASVVSYWLVSKQLYKEFDSSLTDRATQATVLPKASGLQVPNCYVNNRLPGGYFQRIDPNGRVRPLRKGAPLLPVTARDKQVAAGKTGAFTHSATIEIESKSTKQNTTEDVRIYTSQLKGRGCGALQVARSVASLTNTLRRLAVSLLALSLGGIGLAAFLGWVIAGTALGPVRRLTEASEHVARTRDLSRRIETRGRDELARLANSFNTMLEALEISLRAQRQLVADASHELRTPLTTAKTNVEVLRRAELPKEEREAVLRDVSQQIDELAVLVTDIVDLARGVEPNLEVEDVRLDLLVEQTVERIHRLSPGNVFTLELEPCLVRGVPSRLERAIANLLDNACKWSPRDAPIEVGVRDGAVSVRDHGQGIDEADLPYVFDRFYRAPAARALPGSGLGLAIVRQVAESHGGKAIVERPSDGGALIRIELPCTEDV
jgi:two-component system sensor histidine kinase MprB